MVLAMGAEDQPGLAGTTAVHLGRNIQTLREARGRTQEQIARMAGIPRATWANLESGAANTTKIAHGAWLPLLIAIVVFIILITWQRGRVIVTERRHQEEARERSA